MKKKYMKTRYGTTDVEHLALAMYRCYHSEGKYSPEEIADGDGWEPYRKYKDDVVVETFRKRALWAAEDAYADAKYGKIGSIYYDTDGDWV